MCTFGFFNQPWQCNDFVIGRSHENSPHSDQAGWQEAIKVWVVSEGGHNRTVILCQKKQYVKVSTGIAICVKPFHMLVSLISVAWKAAPIQFDKENRRIAKACAQA